MAQATLDRPVSRRPASKTSSKAKNPREKIIWQLAELQAGIAEMVESEEGDCLGRVLEHAGKEVATAAEHFAESDSDASYYVMLDANSFIMAAAALAAQEHCDKAKPATRWASAQRLADLSATIFTAQDQRLTDIASGKVAGVQAQEVEAAKPAAESLPEADASAVTLTLEAARLVSNCSYQIETLILMMQDMARRAEDETTGIELPIVVQALGVRIEQLNQCISDTVSQSPVGPSLEDVRDTVQGQAPRIMQLKQPA